LILDLPLPTIATNQGLATQCGTQPYIGRIRCRLGRSNVTGYTPCRVSFSSFCKCVSVTLKLFKKWV